MFNMADFDLQVLQKGKKPQQKTTYDEDQDQIVKSLVLKKGNKNSIFQDNAAKYDLKDKIILFGGWKPNNNLNSIEVYDVKKNAFEDVLTLARDIRGRPS